jgi:hypothetical protein
MVRREWEAVMSENDEQKQGESATPDETVTNEQAQQLVDSGEATPGPEVGQNDEAGNAGDNDK